MLNQKVEYYPTIFKNDNLTCQTVMKNDFSQLSIVINGVKFQGDRFSDFRVVDLSSLSPTQIQQFDLSTIHYLHNCRFEFAIPQFLLNLATQQQIPYNLQICYELGKLQSNNGLDKEQITASIDLPNLPKITSQGGWFEDVFNDLMRQLNELSTEKYQLQNCFGCQFSDYSIYGNDVFATLMCFVANKDKYALINSKKNYEYFMQEIDNKFDWVQETYCCPHFQPRKKGSGYRG